MAMDKPESQHRARILAKRMRYGLEALHDLLPRKRANRWLQQATRLQTDIGLARDLMQAHALVAQLGLEQGLAEFLRGVLSATRAANESRHEKYRIPKLESSSSP